MTRKSLIAGNWKMNGSLAANAALIDGIVEDLLAESVRAELVVCPPPVYLESVGRRLAGSTITLGAQNLCEQEKQGSFTGEVHGAMLAELGCRYVIVGHSERRALYAEDNALVAQKFATAQICGLTPILCVGETLEQREGGATEDILSRQLAAVLDHSGISAFKNAVVAYEPVWAIGTGRTASPEQAQTVHAFLRGRLSAADVTIAGSTRLLYGGSVKPDNAEALFACPDIDGGLIGGASLKAADFIAIAVAGVDH